MINKGVRHHSSDVICGKKAIGFGLNARLTVSTPGTNLGGEMRMRRTALMGVILLATAAWAQTNLSLPAGTAFKVKLEKTLSTFTSKEGDPFSGRVLDPVVLDGKTVIPVGATVQGRVTKINEPRRIAGKPTIGIFPETVILPSGERYMLNAV